MEQGTAGPSRVSVVERRGDVLTALAGRPMDQRDLRDAVDVSRSTVYKALRELEAADLVGEGDDGRYHLTQFGRLVRRRHDDYEARRRRLEAAEPVLNALPESLLVPLAFAERGRVYTADRHAPERPFAQMEYISEASDDYRCLSPIAVPRYMEQIHERVEDDGLEIELVVERPAVEPLRSYARFDAAIADPRFSLRATDAELPFGLLVTEDIGVACLFTYGENGSLCGMLVSRDPAAYEWAVDQYDRYTEDATAVGTAD
jgi:predicted transcriptional regulator